MSLQEMAILHICQNSIKCLKIPNLITCSFFLNLDTNEYNLERYWKYLQSLSFEFLQLNPLSFPKLSLKFTNFGKWPIILWLPKTIILDSLPTWTWDQKEMKYHTIIFPRMFNFHFLSKVNKIWIFEIKSLFSIIRNF